MPKFKVLHEYEDLHEQRRMQPGDIIDVPVNRVERLQFLGVLGEPIRDEPTERATSEMPETAVKRGANDGRKKANHSTSN